MRRRTTGATGSTDVRLFESGTRFSAAGETRAVAGVWCGAGAPPHWSGGVANGGFLRRQGRGRDARRRVRLATGVRARGRARPSFRGGARRSSDDSRKIGHHRTNRSRRFSTRADCRRTSRSGRSSSTSTRWPTRRPRTICGPSRCRGSRPSCAISRCSSIAPCLRPPFVALSARRHRPTLVHVIEFDRYRGKGVPEGRVSLSLRLTFRRRTGR